MLGLLFMLFFAACDSSRVQGGDGNKETEQATSFNNSPPQTEVDSLRQQNKELQEKLEEVHHENDKLEKELQAERKGSSGARFLVGLFFLICVVSLAYFFRNSIRRAYQQWKGIKHQTRTNLHNQPTDNHAPKEKPVKGTASKVYSEETQLQQTTIHQKLNSKKDLPQDQLEPPATAPPTPTAATAEPQKEETTTEREDVVPPKTPEALSKAPELPTIRYSYGPIDGTLRAFGEEDYDERTTFRIEVAQDEQTATYTVVDNERQQRNVIENQAAYTEAVEYRGEGEGHYANARIQPGTLQRAGDRWRIVDRLIIDRV